MSHLGYEIKKLGFGLMRLPKRGEKIKGGKGEKKGGRLPVVGCV